MILRSVIAWLGHFQRANQGPHPQSLERANSWQGAAQFNDVYGFLGNNPIPGYAKCF